MSSKKYKWLIHFEQLFHPSPSFIEEMNRSLVDQYEEKFKVPFDLQYLLIEFRDDLIYDEENSIARLSCYPLKKERYKKDPSIITWKNIGDNSIIKPSDDITDKKLIFNWEKLIMLPYEMEIAQTSEHSFLDKLELTFPFPVSFQEGNGSSDFLLEISLKDISIITQLDILLGRFQNYYNEAHKVDGIIHSISNGQIDNGKIAYHINTGSAHPISVFRELMFLIGRFHETQLQPINSINIVSI